MAFFLKEIVLLAIVATALTFPWQHFETVHDAPGDSPERVQEDFPLPSNDAPDDPPELVQEDFSLPLHDETAYDHDDPPELVQEDFPPPSNDETVHAHDDTPKRVQEDFPPPSNDGTDSTAVDERPPVDKGKELFAGTSTKRALRARRGVVYNKDKLWKRGPDGKVKITYTFSGDLPDVSKRWLNNVFYHLRHDTCIVFEECQNNCDVIFQGGNLGCSSPIGHKEGRTENVNLGKGCEYRGTIQHEILHLLGFYHEQSRQDRDNYIRVNVFNIMKGAEKQFEKKDQDTMGFPYDVKSIMQYETTAFSKEKGAKTMESKTNANEVLGQISYMDAMDLTKINKLYGCNGPKFEDHTIIVKTSSNWFSGTDADIYLKLVGTEGETPFELVTAGGRIADEAETGSTDVYHIPFKRVGTIKYLEVAMVPQGAEPPSKKRKRSFGISEQGKREPLDGWTAEEFTVDGETFPGADIYPGDKKKLQPGKKK